MLSKAAVLAAEDRFCFLINADQNERVEETLEGLLTSLVVVRIKTLKVSSQQEVR